MYKVIVWSSLIFISVSCAVQKTVYYDTQNIPPNPHQPSIKKTICILTFNDIRMEVAGNEVYLRNPREVYEKKEIYCINSEQHYKKVPLGLQMAWMLADHMMKRGTFKDVVVNNKDSADYIIECNLARITGKHHLPKEIRVIPATGAVIGGVVGMGLGTAYVASIKSKALVSIALTEVKYTTKT